MDFHYQLKQTTKTYHDQIENAPLFKKIIDATITLSEYQLLLKNLYDYISACELAIKHLPYHFLLKKREKTPLLEHDLLALGIDKSTLNKNLTCTHLPQLTEYEHVLGYLYVIEGSTLGGQVITKILQSKLQLTPDKGTCYFYGYGKKTKIMWNNFCETLNNITNSEQQNKIITSVNLTYNTFDHWIRGDVNQWR